MRFYKGNVPRLGPPSERGAFVGQLTAENGERAWVKGDTLLSVIRAARVFIFDGRIEGVELRGLVRFKLYGGQTRLAGKVRCSFSCDGRQLTALELRRASIQEKVGFAKRKAVDAKRIAKLDEDLKKIVGGEP